MAIQAVCLDDKAVPHPASQVQPTKEIDQSYEGELYRCIAGARMQYVLAEYNGQVNFGGGQTVVCEKNQALYHTARAGSNAGPRSRAATATSARCCAATERGSKS